MNVTAVARRVGQWWAVEVPEVEGAFTQVRKLDQVAEMTRDAVALLCDVPRDVVQVNVQPQLEESLVQALAGAREKRAQAERLEREASGDISCVAKQLLGEGMTLREVGIVLGVSYQRVAQLTA